MKNEPTVTAAAPDGGRVPPGDDTPQGGADPQGGDHAPGGSNPRGEGARAGESGAQVVGESGPGGIGGEFRSGFVAVVGRPNVGKSTLTNALVGEKVAITSNRPETTRRQIRGIVHRDGYQVVLVDTPGLHRPRTLLGERLNDMVRESLADVDLVVVCLPADQAIGPGDRFLLNALPSRLAKAAAVTKTDRVQRPALMEKLAEVDALADWRAVVPVAAGGRHTGSDNGPGVEELRAVLGAALPMGPPWYPPTETTDEPTEVRIAELVREAVLEQVRDELPHSVAVLVDEFELPKIHISLYVERDSQKGIVIGRRGARLKAVGSAARPQIEALVGRKVFLEIHVKVAKEWQRDPKALGRLGF
ncbi:MAG: GTPase Era [Bifidobacteriaceae bacterium]|jgi:GTP-binding protein Era|nr:GTPase Era [Bifidobacteriaceae bacterium]